MRKVQSFLVSQSLVVLTIRLRIRKRISSCRKVVRDDAFLDNVGNVVHVIHSHVALVFGVDPVELLERVDGDGVVGGVFAGEAAVGVLDEDAAVDVLLEDSLVDGLGL